MTTDTIVFKVWSFCLTFCAERAASAPDKPKMKAYCGTWI